MSAELATADRVETDIPLLVPARMLNEFAYCPRLAYLEWVQGEFAHSADTLDGGRVHRRVDKPAGNLPEPDTGAQAASPPGVGQSDKQDAGATAGDTIHARSVELSAPVLGMVAVIDLLEAAGAGNVTLTPVDYKKGTTPDHLPERAWEADRVQLCSQGLILRENGYITDSGVIYYAASKTRVPVPFDEALCTRTRELLAQLRETARAGQIPPPLADSPKCPRCSLVGICLPDETRFLAREGAEPLPEKEATPQVHDLAPAPAAALPADSGTKEEVFRLPPPETQIRTLIPARADTRPLYVQEQGASIGKKGDVVQVRSPLGVTLKEVRLAELSHVCLFGNVQITTQTLHELFDRQVPVAYFSFGGWFHGFAMGLPGKNIETRRRQFAAAADPTFCLAFARRCTVAKIENQRTLLRRNAEAPDGNALDDLKRLARKAAQAESLSTLLGLEGSAARLYFAALPQMLKPRAPSSAVTAPTFTFDFTTRNRRPPTDPVNALLSYAYAMLVKDLTVACWMAGLDPFLGYYHQPRFGRPALALDLMEEFRPVLADSAVFTAINTGAVGLEDFIRRGKAVALKPEGRKRFLQAYERRMDMLVTHPLFGYQLSYSRVLEVQARLLTRVLLGELPAYPAFLVK